MITVMRFLSPSKCGTVAGTPDSGRSCAPLSSHTTAEHPTATHRSKANPQAAGSYRADRQAIRNATNNAATPTDHQSGSYGASDRAQVWAAPPADRWVNVL
jgi:hypothetical protein